MATFIFGSPYDKSVTKVKRNVPLRRSATRKRVSPNRKRYANKAGNSNSFKPPRRKKRRPTRVGLRKSLRKKRQKRLKRIILEIGISVGISGFVFYLLSFFVFSMPKVEGYGMMPTLKNEDRVFVNRFSEIKRFSLVYFKTPGTREYSIRRVIGLPGETVEYENDQLWIDGEEKAERFLAEELNKAVKGKYQVTEDFSSGEIGKKNTERIAANSYLVLGDNRQFSSDSRSYGYIKKEDIVGVVKMKWLPLHEMMDF